MLNFNIRKKFLYKIKQLFSKLKFNWSQKIDVEKFHFKKAFDLKIFVKFSAKRMSKITKLCKIFIFINKLNQIWKINTITNWKNNLPFFN